MDPEKDLPSFRVEPSNRVRAGDRDEALDEPASENETRAMQGDHA